MDRSSTTSPLRMLLLRVAVVAISLVITGCGGGRSGDPRSEHRSCPLDPGGAVPGGVVEIALSGGVDPDNLAFPTNSAESLVFRQLYETLVRVDCEGRIHGELAESWEHDWESCTWTFTLRRGATFWDGSALGAADVVAAWLWGRRQAALMGYPLPCALPDPLGEAITILDDRRLRLTLTHPLPGFPELLSWPLFAVSASRPDQIWRLGSGPLRPRTLYRAPGDEFDLLPNRFHNDPPYPTRLGLKVLADGDPRNHVFRGVDAFMLEDADLLTWFQALPELRVVDLAPDILYTVLLPQGSELARLLEGEPGWYRQLMVEVQAGEVLAAGGATPNSGSRGDFLSGPTAARRGSLPPMASTGGSYRIYHPEGDLDAYNLAARIAVLAGAAVGGVELRPVVAPMSEGEQAEWIHSAQGGVVEGVLVLPLRRGDPRRRVAGEIGQLPLALRNLFLVSRKELVGLHMDGDGVPVFTGSGWSGADPPEGGAP